MAARGLRDPDGSGNVSAHFQHVGWNAPMAGVPAPLSELAKMLPVLFHRPGNCSSRFAFAALLQFSTSCRVNSSGKGLRRIRETPAQLLHASVRRRCRRSARWPSSPSFGFPLLDLITACLTVLSLQIAQGRDGYPGCFDVDFTSLQCHWLAPSGIDMLLEEINAAGLPVAVHAQLKFIQAIALQHQRVPAQVLVPAGASV